MEQFNSHSEFWALVQTLEPTPQELADRRMEIAQDPVVRFGLNWMRENSQLEAAVCEEFRERLVESTAGQYCLPLAEVDRAFRICEEMLEHEKAQHG